MIVKLLFSSEVLFSSVSLLDSSIRQFRSASLLSKFLILSSLMNKALRKRIFSKSFAFFSVLTSTSGHSKYKLEEEFFSMIVTLLFSSEVLFSLLDSSSLQFRSANLLSKFLILSSLMTKALCKRIFSKSFTFFSVLTSSSGHSSSFCTFIILTLLIIPNHWLNIPESFFVFVWGRVINNWSFESYFFNYFNKTYIWTLTTDELHELKIGCETLDIRRVHWIGIGWEKFKWVQF